LQNTNVPKVKATTFANLSDNELPFKQLADLIRNGLLIWDTQNNTELPTHNTHDFQLHPLLENIAVFNDLHFHSQTARLD